MPSARLRHHLVSAGLAIAVALHLPAVGACGGGVENLPPPPTMAAPAGSCSSDADCKGGRVCAGSCMSREEAAALPGACKVDSECKGDRVCDSGRCLAGSSSSPAKVASVAPPAPPPAAATPAPPPPAPVSATGPALVSGTPQPTAYAVIVGVETYSAGLPPPTGARADAQRMADVARTTLGITRDHMQVVLDGDATRSGIMRAVEWVKTSAPPGGRVYFYFSGHGAPDASGGTPYIVPADGDPKYLDATAIPMKEVLGHLGQTKAREVLAIVDSCFSGAGGRSVLPPGARPIVRVREEPAPAHLALFAASSGSEISGPAPGGGGGLFTKFVTDGLGTGAADMNGDGQVSLAELSQWVSPRVQREARKDNRDQNPTLTVGTALGPPDAFVVEWGLPSH